MFKYWDISIHFLSRLRHNVNAKGSTAGRGLWMHGLDVELGSGVSSLESASSRVLEPRYLEENFSRRNEAVQVSDLLWKCTIRRKEVGLRDYLRSKEPF